MRKASFFPTRSTKLFFWKTIYWIIYLLIWFNFFVWKICKVAKAVIPNIFFAQYLNLHSELPFFCDFCWTKIVQLLPFKVRSTLRLLRGSSGKGPLSHPFNVVIGILCPISNFYWDLCWPIVWNSDVSVVPSSELLETKYWFLSNAQCVCVNAKWNYFWKLSLPICVLHWKDFICKFCYKIY